MAAIETLSPAGSIAFGLAAATIWGICDFLAATYTRRFGMIRTLSVSSFGALLTYVVAYLATKPSIDLTTSDLLGMAALALSVTGTYVAFYKALAIGPIAVVAPIVAAFAAVVVLASYIFLGETLTSRQSVGAAAALIGVMLASVDLGSLAPGDRRMGRGVTLAVAALLGFGATTFVSGFYAKQHGYVVPPLVTRPLITLLFLAALLVRPRSSGPALRIGGVASLVLLGALDSAGFLVYLRGAEIGSLSLVSLASASYPLIPLTLGLVVFKEKIVANQWVGIAAVLGGIALLST